MADNNMINEVKDAMEQAGLEVTDLEPVIKKGLSDKMKGRLEGTLIGAALVVIGGKVIKTVRESKDEITETNKKAKITKAEKDLAKAQEKLAKLQQAAETNEVEAEDQPEEETPDNEVKEVKKKK